MPDTGSVTVSHPAAEERGTARAPAGRAAATAADAARPQPATRARRLARLLADVWRKGDRDRILGLAGENAFMGVLTLFPTLLVFAAVTWIRQSVARAELRTAEKLLEIELRLAEMGEAVEAKPRSADEGR